MREYRWENTGER